MKNTEEEFPQDRWLQSHYTYAGDVFDTPEHQAALSKLKKIEERIAYKQKILKQQRRELLGDNSQNS